MRIDWLVVATIVGPLVAVVIGIFLDRYFERRARLISWLGHTSAINFKTQEGQAISIHTHAVIIRNVGRMPAHNVKLGHYILPNFSVYPTVSYSIADTPGGGKEIVFSTLVPNEQITVTYIYFPPTLWSQINSYTKSDEGMAQVITVFPVRQYPAWVYRILWVVLFVGTVTIIYLLIQLVIWLYVLRSVVRS